MEENELKLIRIVEENELKLIRVRTCCNRLPYIFAMSKDENEWGVCCSVCWKGNNIKYITKHDAIIAWEKEGMDNDECT